MTVSNAAWLRLCSNSAHCERCTDCSCCTNSISNGSTNLRCSNRNNCYHCTNWSVLNIALTEQLIQVQLDTFTGVAPGAYNVTVRNAA